MEREKMDEARLLYSKQIRIHICSQSIAMTEMNPLHSLHFPERERARERTIKGADEEIAEDYI